MRPGSRFSSSLRTIAKSERPPTHQTVCVQSVVTNQGWKIDLLLNATLDRRGSPLKQTALKAAINALGVRADWSLVRAKVNSSMSHLHNQNDSHHRGFDECDETVGRLWVEAETHKRGHRRLVCWLLWSERAHSRRRCDRDNKLSASSLNDEGEAELRGLGDTSGCHAGGTTVFKWNPHPPVYTRNVPSSKE